MNTPRRVRRNKKPLDALKAAAIIMTLLLGCILALWFASRMLHPVEPPPDLERDVRPARTMWENSERTR